MSSKPRRLHLLMTRPEATVLWEICSTSGNSMIPARNTHFGFQSPKPKFDRTQKIGKLLRIGYSSVKLSARGTACLMPVRFSIGTICDRSFTAAYIIKLGLSAIEISAPLRGRIFPIILLKHGQSVTYPSRITHPRELGLTCLNLLYGQCY